MKYSTHFLFDQPRSRYEPWLTILANKRIADGQALLKKLAKTKKQSDIPRYEAVEKSVNWWKEILDEPSGPSN